MAGHDDQMIMTRSLNVMPETTGQHSFQLVNLQSICTTEANY